MYEHDDPVEGGWVLVLNHVGLQSYSPYKNKVLEEDDFREAVSLDFAAYAPLESSGNCVEEELD